ncbi:siderophore-interacting protein [Sphaerisporangium aureirubrum]|uniref:Siderophore-interacting protein n=1 Tax=Sphaerisporangium aureirubrum TaxID=1544736 RepID=A0ABW1NAX1_9ACTN
MSVLDRVLLAGAVEECEPVTPSMRRVRISGTGLRDLDWVPGQHVRLKVGDLLSPQVWLSGFRDVLRTYSIWHYDRGGILDLCVLDHPGAGPGALWARGAVPGTKVLLTRPDGRLVVRRESPYHLFAGDETALAAFDAMLRAVPAGEPVYGAVTVPAADHRLPLARLADLTWVYGDGGASEALVGAVRELSLPAGPGTAYVAGEARACQAVLRHLVRERGWPRAAVRVKAFWAPGKRGMD